MAGTPVKIAFSGAACTGKTWLMGAMRKRTAPMGSAGFVDEVSRDLLADTPPEWRRTVEAQSIIQKAVRKREEEAQSKGFKLLFCDRSVADASVYIWALGDHDGARRLYDEVRPWMPTYDVVFLLDPHDVNFGNDEVRIESVDLRNTVHDAFVELFDAMELPYRMLTGSRSARVEQVVDAVEELGIPLTR